MIKKMSKKIAAILMTLAMVLSLMPALTLTARAAAYYTANATTGTDLLISPSALFGGYWDDASYSKAFSRPTSGGNTGNLYNKIKDTVNDYTEVSPYITTASENTYLYETFYGDIKFKASAEGVYEFTCFVNEGALGTDVAAYQVQITVTDANTAPTVTNLNGDSVPFKEGDSAVLLDKNSDATVTDSDSPTSLNGGNVTALISANPVAGEDVLSIKNTGTATGQIGVSGADVSYSGTKIGTYTGGTGSNNLVVTLNSSATLEATTALIRALTYANTNSADPSTVARTVRVTVNDGSGGTSSNADVSVSITAVNDAPTLTAMGASPTFTEDGSAAALFSGASVSAVESGQSITELKLTVSNLADGSNEVLNAYGTDIALTNGTSGTTATNSMAYSVSVSDVTATVTLSKLSGITAADTKTLVEGISYKNNSNTPTTTSGRVVTLTSIKDSGGIENSGADATALSIASTVTVAANNDAPVNAVPATITVKEDVATALTGISFADIDAGSSNVTVTLSVGSGTLAATTGDGVTVGGSVTAITITGLIADINSFIAASKVTFTTAANATANVTLTVAINDGGYTGSGGEKTDSDNVTLTVTNVNDAPTVTATGKNPTFTEDGGAVQLFSPVTVSAVESAQKIIELNLTVSNVTDGADETLIVDGKTLALTSGSGTINSTINYTVSLAAGTATVTLSQAAGFADAQYLVTWLSYQNTSNTPTTTSGRVVTLTSIKDSGGIENSGADTTTLSIASTVTVASSNDAPENSVPASIAVTEDVATALTGISFSDADAGSSASVTATLSVGSGTLAATSSGNVTVGGTATAMTLSGKIADINAFIAASNVTFTSASNATANVTLTVAINDGGNTGSGGAKTDSDNVTLTVTNVNDAPTSISLDNASIAEGTAADTKIGTLSTTDPDSGDSFTYTIQSVKDKNNNAASLDTFAISGSELRTKAALSYSTNNSYTVTIQTKDSNNLTYEKVFTITVTEINAAPTNIALSETNAEENKGADFEVATLTATDPNASDITFTYALVTGDGSTDNGSFNILDDKLRLTASADYETKNSYSVRIKATDSGGLSTEKIFTITITNVNEAPVLTASGGTSAFMEAATGTSTPVLVDGGLTVADVDSGTVLSAVTATISSNCTSTQDVLSFTNDGSTMGNISASYTSGVLTLTSEGGTATVAQWQAALRAVKYTNTSHNPTTATRTVTFSVSDGALSATATKNVSVTQTNTAPTDIALSASSIAENSSIGTAVGTLTATDGDTDDSYTCTLVSGYGDNASFTIESVSVTNYTLKLAEIPNYEVKSSYSIRVCATDLASATYTEDFTVTITDVNEAPTISTATTANFAENGTGTVYDADASDPDTGNTITFSISGTDAGLFDINSGTGVLTFKTAPNFEAPADSGANNVYDLTVTATDNGTVPLNATKTLAVTVTNVNEAPAISTGAAISVTEGSTTAFTAAATDPEADSVTWSVSGGTDAGKFSIVTDTGVVTFATAPSYSAPTDSDAKNDYVLEITASDGTLSVAKTVTITVTQKAIEDGASSTSTVVEVNGQKQDAGTSSTATSGGQTVTTIKVDDTKLDKILESSGEKPTVTLPSAGSDVTVGELNGQTVKNMEAKEATLEIKTETVTYSLPASQINIDAVTAQLGEQVALNDIKVSIKIAEPSADTVKVVEDTAIKGNYQLVVKPVEFKITCTSGDKTIEVSKFNGYVERTVAIPDGVDPSKITTGIVLNEDGTFRHVPTEIVVINGKYYAKINSLTNSTYSVIYNPVEFADVANHWAKAAINDMGSRMVVTGVGSSTYEPYRSITRAEFAAIVVRAMGLAQGTTESAFGDVSLSDWFNGYVDTATSYSLITGYDSASYGPNDTITREQAMAILARAMKLTGLNISITDSEVNALLANYTDGASVSDYAKISTAICIKTGVVTGSSATTLSPKTYVTRAEVAVMVQRLLKNSGLI